MSQQLGRGLGALLSSSSKPTLDPPDKYKTIRDKERKLEELKTEVENESRSLEDLRKRLTIELMLNGKVDKTDLFRMEEELNEKVKEKEKLIKDIESLKEEVRTYVKVDIPTEGVRSQEGPGFITLEDDLSNEIDMRLIRELMPQQQKETPDDEEHIQGLKNELDRTKQVEEVRREVYGEERSPPPRPIPDTTVTKTVRRVVAPRRVRVIRGTARPIYKKRDNRMFELVEDALRQMSSGDIQGSRSALEGVLKEYPNDDEVLYHIGNTYFMENNWVEAEALFRKAIEKNPRSYRALNNLGIVLQKQDNKESAIRVFNQALEIDQDYERAWLNLGSIFMEIEPPMLREASIFLKRALEVQPSLKKARDKLEECKARLKLME